MLPGLGMDSHKVQIKNDSNLPFYVSTTMYNLYYILPIPIINLTLGVGTGKSQFEFLGLKGDDGTATQWYTSLGIPILPLFDLHLSYRSVSSKIKVKAAYGGVEAADLSGNVMGLGIGFNF